MFEVYRSQYFIKIMNFREVFFRFCPKVGYIWKTAFANPSLRSFSIIELLSIKAGRYLIKYDVKCASSRRYRRFPSFICPVTVDPYILYKEQLYKAITIRFSLAYIYTYIKKLKLYASFLWMGFRLEQHRGGSLLFTTSHLFCINFIR